MSDVLPVRVIYRSRGIQLSLLAAMEAADAWRQAGLDTGGPVPWVASAADSDPMLEAGKIDFIFGSHVTPYIRYAEGVPFVYLGQTVNYVDDVVVTAEPISAMEDLRGKRVADRIDRERHSHGNRVLFLRRAGIDEDAVTWIDRTGRKGLDVVVSGEADAVFLNPYEAERAEAAGLSVFVPPRLPMVIASTITTLWPVVQNNPDLCRRVIQAVRTGIAFFKNEPEAMRKVMREVVGPALELEDEGTIDRLYQRNAGLLDETLYPRLESISNAWALAVRQKPGIEKTVRPEALWDLHFLRELDESA